MSRMVARVLALALIAATQLAFAAGAAAHPVLGGFQGSWTTIDCANGGGSEPQCSTWGDGSAITMKIGFGKNPKVTIKDTYATACVEAGATSSRWAGAGTGWYTQDVDQATGAPGPIYLHVSLSSAGCGTHASLGDLGRDLPVETGGVLTFYHDLGSDSIWFDPDGDGAGLGWSRTN